MRGSWHEFLRDFLARNPLAPELDKAKTAQRAKDVINSRKPDFLIHYPNKEGWTAEDHHVRFIAAVVTDNMLKGMWSESDWKKKGLEIAKNMFEVLVFLRATTFPVADPHPPRYEEA